MSDIEFSNIDNLFALHLLKREDHPLFSFCKELMKASREGHLFLERENLDNCIDLILNQEDSPIIVDDNCYYLKRNYFYEKEIATYLFDRSKLPLYDQKILPPPNLNPMQKKAFELLNTSPFFLLTGGPGSGKSFTAKQMIKAYKAIYPEKKIICTAPTGKALSALCESLEESLTLHKLLEIKDSFEIKEKKTYIIADLLIVDECSMISPKLFHLLLSSLLDFTQVIFVGDPNQLPPVSGASIFYDFTTLPILKNVSLNDSMRSDKKAILAFADAIIKEDEEEIKNILEEDNEITLSPITSFHPKINTDGHILLTPFRKGPYGSLSLNEKIYPQKDQSIPILITKNDPITKLTNGDIGFIKGQIATFAEKNIVLPTLMLPPYEKAFALSIHKSQGSEFDHVSILLPKEATCFSKELLFTAVTRAKKSIHIYGCFETLISLIKNKKKNSSNLFKKIYALSQP
jgi:exodeoxyribonuclease V alpha subunit